ncbi:MAG: 16S rRNA (uracil(1498)-N(3))-methyltransferase [Thermoanaerobaculia bacterium]
MLNRFLHPGPFSTGGRVALIGDELHHAAKVHRARVGEEVELFDGRGSGVRARVLEVTREAMQLEVVAAIVDRRESPIEIQLALALIHPDKFELALQKGTEIGVSSFLPLQTARCEVRTERVRGKGERWEKILVEAAKQSGRLVVPALEVPLPFEQALAAPGVNVMLDPSGTADIPEGESLRLFIGPEGGWSDEELAAAREMGARVWSLGPRRLRAETAAIAACALLILKPS